MLSHEDAEDKEQQQYRDWLLWWHAKLTRTQCNLPCFLSHVPVKGFSGAPSDTDVMDSLGICIAA